MNNLTNPSWIKAKGILFLIVGILSGVLLILENRTWRVAVLLAVSVWCFCRFYYFAFYVIEKYVDLTYKFSGLWSFARYFFQSRQRGKIPSTKLQHPEKHQPPNLKQDDGDGFGS